MNFNIGDLILFEKYNFNDSKDGNIREHYAFVMIPSEKSKNYGQIYCAVVTSTPTKELCLELDPSKYSFLRKKSYICFQRLDLQSISDIKTRITQPIGTINNDDLKKCFELLKIALFSSSMPTSKMHKFLKSVLMREWEKALKI